MPRKIHGRGAVEDWKEYCRVMANRANRPDAHEPIDWLGVCIHRLGGATKAARHVGMNRATVYEWLRLGLGRTEFETVVLLASGSDIPLDVLAERLGPFDPRAHHSDGRRP